MKTRVAVLLSGGLDSTVAMAVANAEANLSLAVSVDYGQRHVKEIEAAAAVAAFYKTEHLIIDLSQWGSLLQGSALTDPTVPVPEEAYAGSNMALTVVPNRNAAFLMTAVGIAQSRGLESVWTAIHAGDHQIYADCRPEFLTAINEVARIATENQVTIEAPFVNTDKSGIVERGALLGAPLSLTWSCYKGEQEHCGRCGTCVERRTAFEVAGVNDPTLYEGALR